MVSYETQHYILNKKSILNVTFEKS